MRNEGFRREVEGAKRTCRFPEFGQFPTQAYRAYSPMLGLPLVVRRFRYPVPRAQISVLCSRLRILWYANDLLFQKPCALHLLSLLQARLSSRLKENQGCRHRSSKTQRVSLSLPRRMLRRFSGGNRQKRTKANTSRMVIFGQPFAGQNLAM